MEDVCHNESVFLSVTQMNTLLEQDIAGIQRKMEEFLNFKPLQTDLKEAILVDYYIDGFIWGREKGFTAEQLTDLMGLLYTLMDNLKGKQMLLKENLKELRSLLIGIGQSYPEKKGTLRSFNVEQAKAIISYLKISLFQHYKLYECLFNTPRDLLVFCAEQTVSVVKSDLTFPAPLEEGIPSEIYLQYIAPPPSPSPRSEPEMIMTDINEKLGEQEKAFNAKIETLQKP
ncbi:hypothetical protein GDO86_013497 [Hymenochirus boettgeri]|uniref:Ciliary associated calcium binding coiled-coil 1 n=1 Tax=Hymenochirus boettgeri TaxID=247094 RepID=A0A8T2IYR6_9PIPI|nr:hypothetical protein GDO86_013497 [Hymenochirus boettgeri]KAG8435582.1 hypothetical protein GDO86_013497 [Hymenochirus boettgeri]